MQQRLSRVHASHPSTVRYALLMKPGKAEPACMFELSRWSACVCCMQADNETKLRPCLPGIIIGR